MNKESLQSFGRGLALTLLVFGSRDVAGAESPLASARLEWSLHGARGNAYGEIDLEYGGSSFYLVRGEAWSGAEILTSRRGDSWSLLHTFPQNIAVQHLLASSEGLVAAGVERRLIQNSERQATVLLFSLDGKSWQEVFRRDLTDDWRLFEWSQFTAAGDFGWIILARSGDDGWIRCSSIDGTTWKFEQTLGLPIDLTVTRKNLKLLENRFILPPFRSHDGLTWTSGDIPGHFISFDGNNCLSIDDKGGIVRISHDGLAWSDLSRIDPTVSTFRSFSLTSMASNRAGHVVSSNYNVFHSVDGMQWDNTLTWNDLAGGFAEVTAGESTFVAAARQSVLWHSTDGIAWKPAVDFIYPDTSIVANESIAVGISASTFRIDQEKTLGSSEDGIVWEWHDTPATLVSVACSEDIFVAVGGGGTIIRSLGGRDWENASDSKFRENLFQVKYLGGYFFALSKGSMLRSGDGARWNRVGSDVDSEIKDMTFANGQYYVATSDGVYISSDGDRFEAPGFRSVVQPDVIVYGNKRFVGANRGSILVSNDSQFWQKTNIERPGHITQIEYSEVAHCFFAVDSGTGEVLGSPDGEKWFQLLDTVNPLSDITVLGSKLIATGRAGLLITELRDSGSSAEFPIIKDVNPSPVPLLNRTQRIDIHGEGFHKECLVHLYNLTTGEKFLNQERTVGEGGDIINLNANFMVTDSMWTVVVVNPVGLPTSRTFEVGEGASPKQHDVENNDPDGKVAEVLEDVEEAKIGRQLVVVAHGWLSNRDVWAVNFVKDILDKTDNTRTKDDIDGSFADRGFYALGDTHGLAYDWSVDAGPLVSPIPGVAAYWAKKHGESLADEINQLDYKQIYLVGHSAGAWLVDAIADNLNDEYIVYTTYLDAFTLAAGELGDTDKYTDHYQDLTPTNESLGAILDTALIGRAGAPIDDAFNLDVTSTKSDADRAIGTPVLANHSWPIKWYIGKSKGTGYGIDRAIAFLANGSLPDDEGICARMAENNASVSVLLDCSYPFDVNRMVEIGERIGIEIGDAILETGSAEWDSVANRLDIFTNSPGYALLQVKSESRINILEFSTKFIPAGQSSEGFLQVYWGERLIGTVEERFADSGESERIVLRLPHSFPAGSYPLTFRLDPYSQSPSRVFISDLEAGFMTTILVGADQDFESWASVDERLVHGGGDPDGDGYTNFEEFALGTNPLVESDGIGYFVETETGIMNFRYEVPYRVGVNVTLEESMDMRTWRSAETKIVRLEESSAIRNVEIERELSPIGFFRFRVFDSR